MKVSEITSQLVAEYVKEDWANLTDAEKAFFSVILTAAKAYVKSYTGHVDETVTGEILTEDGVYPTIFYTAFSPVVSGTLKVYVNSVEVTSGCKVDLPTGTITFDAAPAMTPTADYTAGIDAFEDFAIAVYVLCQDMYDNRAMYVDNNNVNRVVETILGMHCINLL